MQDLNSYATRIGEEHVRFVPTGSAQKHLCPGPEGCLDLINPGTLPLREFEAQSVGETTFRLWTGSQWTEPSKIMLSRVVREMLPWISFWALALTVLVMMAPIAIARSPGHANVFP
jgi:hypothetical protein